ncbi:cation transporter, partial [Rhodovulum sulfidophilum]|nr:cation transporter [Rhodovulum sulfidophilum]
RFTLSVEGMSCASCTGRVERVLKAQPGVIEATANLASRRAQVTLWEGAATAAALAQAVTKAGFAASSLTADAPDRRAEEMAMLGRDAWLAALLTIPVFLVEMGGHLVPAFHHWIAGTIGTQTSWIAQFLQ